MLAKHLIAYDLGNIHGEPGVSASSKINNNFKNLTITGHLQISPHFFSSTTRLVDSFVEEETRERKRVGMNILHETLDLSAISPVKNEWTSCNPTPHRPTDHGLTYMRPTGYLTAGGLWDMSVHTVFVRLCDWAYTRSRATYRIEKGIVSRWSVSS